MRNQVMLNVSSILSSFSLVLSIQDLQSVLSTILTIVSIIILIINFILKHIDVFKDGKLDEKEKAEIIENGKDTLDKIENILGGDKNDIKNK